MGFERGGVRGSEQEFQADEIRTVLCRERHPANPTHLSESRCPCKAHWRRHVDPEDPFGHGSPFHQEQHPTRADIKGKGLPLPVNAFLLPWKFLLPRQCGQFIGDFPKQGDTLAVLLVGR